MSDSKFHTLAAAMRDHDIEAEAVTDAEGRAASVRLYVDGRAFNLVPTVDDDGRARITIEQYEAEEPETPEERLEHVVEVVRMTGIHADR